MVIFGKILLASNSPRRYHLLQEAGFDVEVVKGYEVNEVYPEKIDVQDIPAFLSQKKAEPYIEMARERDLPLVAADTVVILDGQVMGKPKDEFDAVNMLKKLSGKWHDVVSGVTLVFPDSEQITFSELTKVKFSSLDDDLIKLYVNNAHPMDKAGSYGVQELIGLAGVERIEGDYYNIMGFPVCMFLKFFLSKYPSLLSEKFD